LFWSHFLHLWRQLGLSLNLLYLSNHT
jgi:hypothetical protein